MSLLYRAAMFLGSLWCHQLPGRSPHLWGTQSPLCWRCVGILCGALALLCWALRRKRLPPLGPSLGLALLLPLDVLHAVASGGGGANWRRLVTGLLWGFCGTGAALRLLGLALRARDGGRKPGGAGVAAPAPLGAARAGGGAPR